MRLGNLRRHGFVLALALAWAGPVDGNLQNLLPPLVAARNAGRAGEVTGSVVAEPKSPRGVPTPLPGAALVLVPRSPELLRDLEQVKARARESEAGYLGAAAEVSRLRDRFEQALVDSGAGELVFPGASDAGGRFVLSRVPAGEWLLLGHYETVHRPRGSHPSPRERRNFRLGPEPAGYRAVTYWLVSVKVAEGDVVNVELTGRNLWLRGVVQEYE